jgi:hypothetical protein
MRRRTWISLTVAAAIVAALAVMVYLRKNAPPEAARLLPESQAIVYFNLKPLRDFTHLDRHPVHHDADYQAFIDATGIEFERDLDQAAFAVHELGDPSGPNGPVAYSEIFRGHFDGSRLTAYLAAQAQRREKYAGHDIYFIPHQGRTVRVSILGYDLVAVSNTPTAEQIHSMIDRYHTSASPFSGSTLLARYYSQVPLLSTAWAIGRIGLPLSTGKQFQVFGLTLPLSVDTPFIASIRYLGSIHFRLEEIAPSAEAAKTTVGMATMALGMLRAAQVNSGVDEQAAQDWNTLLQNTSVQQKGDRAILRAVVPAALIQDLVRGQSAAVGGPAPVPEGLPAH